jgi:WD40 repeat protein
MSHDPPVEANASGSDELSGRLREAVEKIRASPVPDGLSAKVIDRAAVRTFPPRSNFWTSTQVISRAAAALILIFLGTAAVRYWINKNGSDDHETNERQVARSTSDRPQSAASHPSTVKQPAADSQQSQHVESENSSARGAMAAGKGDKQVHAPQAQTDAHSDGINATSDGRQPLGGQAFGASPGGQQSKTSRGLGAGASPSRRMTVARDATVFVSTGGSEPIAMGHAEPWSRESTLHVWDWSKGDKSRPLDAAHSGPLAVSADGKWLALSDGRLIDLSTGNAQQLQNFDGNVGRLAFAPDGETLILIVYAPQYKARLRAMSLPTGVKRYEIADQWSYTFAIAFTADSREMILMDKDRILRRWDVATSKELMSYEPAHVNSIAAIAVSADGRFLASAGTRGDIHVWELKTGNLLHTLAAPETAGLEAIEVYSLAFSPNGKVLAGGGIHQIVFWEAKTGRRLDKKLPSSAGAYHLHFSKDGNEITAVRDFHGRMTDTGADLLVYPTVARWNIETGAPINGD